MSFSDSSRTNLILGGRFLKVVDLIIWVADLIVLVVDLKIRGAGSQNRGVRDEIQLDPAEFKPWTCGEENVVLGN